MNTRLASAAARTSTAAPRTSPRRRGTGVVQEHTPLNRQ
jgi:hypothetical protein